MIYLGWFDDNNKKQTADKINEAIERYEFKYGIAPNVCLVSEREAVEHPRLTIRPASHLRPNYYYVGYDESLGPRVAVTQSLGVANAANTPIQIPTSKNTKLAAKPAAKRVRKAA